MATQGTNPILKAQSGESKVLAANNCREIASLDLGIRRRVIGLFAANVFSILITGISFVIYSRILTPSEFGLYAVALSLATMLALILDGGLKTTIIKADQEIEAAEESSIAYLMMLVSVVLVLILVVIAQPVLAAHSGIVKDTRFVLLFVGISLVFYPFVTLPTAKLERDLRYEHVAWIESLGTIVERAGPALILLLTGAGIYSFILALFVSRLLRSVILAQFKPIRLGPTSRQALSKCLVHLKDGAWIQAGTISSVVRDNLHTLLVGPLFGKEWVGYYAWALQVCLVSSQVFAQISARVSLPLLAQAGNFKERWAQCRSQIRMLTALAVPMLCAVWLVLPSIDSKFFQGKWQPAMVLIPLFFVRMIPGMATTPLGPLLIVHRGGLAYGLANLGWTLAEAIAAGAFLYVLGPMGLAWSYAVVVWFGLLLMMLSLNRRSATLIRDVIQDALFRPSALCAVCATAAIIAPWRLRSVTPQSWMVYVAAVIVILTSYLTDPDLRHIVFDASA